MKANSAFIAELKTLLVEYEGEVNKSLADGYLKESTAKTYLLHSNNFVKWCNGSFIPGGTNMTSKIKK